MARRKNNNYSQTGMIVGGGAVALLAIVCFGGLIIWNGIQQAQISDIQDDIDDNDDHIKNLRNAVNPVEIPNGYMRNMAEHPDEDDDGINSDDDDDDGKQDTASRNTHIVGDFIATDYVNKNGDLIKHGHADFFVPLTVTDKNITVIGAGSLVSPNYSIIETGVVCSSETAGIQRGKVVGYNNGCLQLGYSTNELWQMSVDEEPYGLNKFSLGPERSGIVYQNDADELAMRLFHTDQNTNQASYSTEFILSATGYTFNRRCGIVAVQYPGDANHFVIVWEEETGGNGVLAATCRIDSETPLAVTCTAVPVAFNAGISTVPFFLDHVSGTEFVLAYSDATNGLSAVTITSSSTTLATSFNAPTVIDATIVSTTSTCFAFDAFMRGNGNMVVAFGDAITSTPVSVQQFGFVGTAVTSLAPAVPITTITGAEVNIRAIGTSQIVFALNTDSGSFILDLSVANLTPTSIDVASITSTPLSLASAVPSITNSGQTDIVELEENLVGLLYFSSDLGFSDYVQTAKLRFEGTTPHLVLGERQAFTNLPIVESDCARIEGANATSFSCVFVNREGFAATDYETNSIVVRVGEDKGPTVGRQLKVVHNKPSIPVGIAVTSAAAGESIQFLEEGTFTDASLFNYTDKEDVCLQCDGSLSPASSTNNFYLCSSHCACASKGAHSIKCDNIYRTRHHTPEY